MRSCCMAVPLREPLTDLLRARKPGDRFQEIAAAFYESAVVRSC
jgi:hypothetical protein